MIYRIVQEFLRIEAIGMRGSRHGDPADPVALQVRVTLSSDIATVMEEVEVGAQLYKLQTGLWAFQLVPSRYQAGVAYTVHFRYEMTPGNLNVTRKNFVWAPVPAAPRLSGNCVVTGALFDVGGAPVPEQRLVVEQYQSIVTLNERTAMNTIVSDAFGNWFFEIPHGALVRFVFGNVTKIIKVPELAQAALSSIPEFQPTGVQTDKFGYPFP